MTRVTRYFFLLLLLAVHTGWCAMDVQVGQQARTTLVISGPRLVVKPQALDTPVYLRVEDVRAVDGGFAYTLAGCALTAGSHDLLDYLEPALPGEMKGNPLGGLDAVLNATATVKSDAPVALSPLRLQTPLGKVLYREGMLLASVIWVLVPIVVIFIRHRNRAVATEEVVDHGASLAEQLRELAELVARPGSTPAQKARLERVALQYWSERKGCQGTPPDALIALLKRDPEAAAQLTLQERWLHAPGGEACSADDVVARYLEPEQEEQD